VVNSCYYSVPAVLLAPGGRDKSSLTLAIKASRRTLRDKIFINLSTEGLLSFYLLFINLYMKKKSGNISILVIFVLLASSLLGILSMNFVQQMIQQSAVVNSYYKTYYLSKAWLELGLAQIKHRGIGFNYTVNTGDQIVLDNFLCGPNCSLSASISGTASLLSKKFWQGSGCSSPYILSGGESLIVPLFRDNYIWDVVGTFTRPISGENLAAILKYGTIDFIPTWIPWKLIFGLLILSGQELHENWTYFQPGTMNGDGLTSFIKTFEKYYLPLDPTIANYYTNSDFPHFIYLLISNNDSYEQLFCLDLGKDILPTDTFFIQSQASYGNQKVALDASYAQPIPGFLFNTYSSYTDK